MASPPPTSLSLSLDSTLQPLLLHSSHHPSTSFPSLSLHKHHHPFHFKSSSSSPSPPSPPKSSLSSPPRSTGPFLDSTGLSRLQALEKVSYRHEFDHGSLQIRPMQAEELDATVQLLAESFAESMWMPDRYVALLAYLVKQYVMERRLLIPHTATLVGYYKESGKDEAQLACTAEMAFDALGANAAPPTPTPPKNCPYICNMTVKKTLRRRGIGWHLLKACEALISQMKTSKKIYLHCRVIDTGAFNMYTRAGYKIVKSDSILIWLTLQRRKYLMSKNLPVLNDNNEPNS